MSRLRLIHKKELTTRTGTVHDVKVYRTDGTGEFIVKYSTDNTSLEKNDYYTDCKLDAIDSADYYISYIRKQFGKRNDHFERV